jgi:hypothetical protein
MIVSSRTPEGDDARCPVCNSVIRVEFSRPSLDATCSACGVLLWLVKLDATIWCFEATSIEEQNREDLDRRLQHADSVEVVELVLELEELARGN